MVLETTVMSTLPIVQHIAVWLSVSTMLWWTGLFILWRCMKARAVLRKEESAAKRKRAEELQNAEEIKQKAELEELRQRDISTDRRRMKALGIVPEAHRSNSFPMGMRSNARPLNDPVRLLNESKLTDIQWDSKPLPRPVEISMQATAAGYDGLKQISDKSRSTLDVDDFIAVQNENTKDSDSPSLASEPKTMASGVGGDNLTIGEGTFREAKRIMIPNEEKLPQNYRLELEKRRKDLSQGRGTGSIKTITSSDFSGQSRSYGRQAVNRQGNSLSVASVFDTSSPLQAEDKQNITETESAWRTPNSVDEDDNVTLGNEASDVRSARRPSDVSDLTSLGHGHTSFLLNIRGSS